MIKFNTQNPVTLEANNIIVSEREHLWEFTIPKKTENVFIEFPLLQY